MSILVVPAATAAAWVADGWHLTGRTLLGPLNIELVEITHALSTQAVEGTDPLPEAKPIASDSED